MAQAKNASTLGVHLENWVIAELERRAELLGWSKSQYAAYILTQWYNSGAQPINDMERNSLVALPLDPKPGAISPITWIGSTPRKADAEETVDTKGKKNTSGAAKRAASSG